MNKSISFSMGSLICMFCGTFQICTAMEDTSGKSKLVQQEHRSSEDIVSNKEQQKYEEDLNVSVWGPNWKQYTERKKCRIMWANCGNPFLGMAVCKSKTKADIIQDCWDDKSIAPAVSSFLEKI